VQQQMMMKMMKLTKDQQQQEQQEQVSGDGTGSNVMTQGKAGQILSMAVVGGEVAACLLPPVCALFSVCGQGLLTSGRAWAT